MDPHRRDRRCEYRLMASEVWRIPIVRRWATWLGHGSNTSVIQPLETRTPA